MKDSRMTFDVFDFPDESFTSYSYLMRGIHEKRQAVWLKRKNKKVENLQIKTIMGIAIRDNE